MCVALVQQQLCQLLPVLCQWKQVQSGDEETSLWAAGLCQTSKHSVDHLTVISSLRLSSKDSREELIRCKGKMTGIYRAFSEQKLSRNFGIHKIYYYYLLYSQNRNSLDKCPGMVTTRFSCSAFVCACFCLAYVRFGPKLVFGKSRRRQEWAHTKMDLGKNT